MIRTGVSFTARMSSVPLCMHLHFMFTGQQTLSRMWSVVMFMPVMHVPFPQSDAHDQQAGDYHANNKVYDQVFHGITSLKK